MKRAFVEVRFSTQTKKEKKKKNKILSLLFVFSKLKKTKISLLIIGLFSPPHISPKPNHFSFFFSSTSLPRFHFQFRNLVIVETHRERDPQREREREIFFSSPELRLQVRNDLVASISPRFFLFDNYFLCLILPLDLVYAFDCVELDELIMNILFLCR